MKKNTVLPNFVTLSPSERLSALRQYMHIHDDTYDQSIDSLLQSQEVLTQLADAMIESTVGNISIPLGIICNLCVDGVLYNVPVATEEASVIVAANYASRIFSKAQMGDSTTKGVITTIETPLHIAQVSLYDVDENGEKALLSKLPELKNMLMSHLSSMHRRGGGLRGVEYRKLENNLLVVHIVIDVRDIMGANVVTGAAEFIAPEIAKITGGTVLAAILSNYTVERLVHASITLDSKKIPTRGKPAQDVARNIAYMSQWAEHDIYRAVTHNKGIMNGITGLALATYNDTRAIESAAHSFAINQIGTPHSSNSYGPLSTWEYNSDTQSLTGRLHMPALLATKGGATSHPVAQWSRTLLSCNCHSEIRAHTLNRVAAGLGLAQNFAALLALVTEGIQKGHLKYHNKKLHITGE